MNSTRTKIPRILKIMLVTAVLVVLSVTSTFAASREFKYSKSGAILVLLDDGTTYRENDTGGAKAFVPFSISRSGDNMAVLSKMTVLPGSQTGYGDWASSAALRYNAFNAYTGANSQYLAKIGAVKTKANAGSTWIVPPYYNHNTNEMFVFRYAGMVVTGDSAMAGTNPIFPSDRIGSTSSSGSSTPATIYKRKIDSDTGGISWPSETITLYGTAGGVHSFEDIYTNGMNGTSVFEGVGNIVSNKYTTTNEKYAEQAFKKWIDCDDGYGKEYAEKAAAWKVAKDSPLEVWQILNQFFQIQGDPSKEDSTLYFYMVGGKVSKHTFYATYSTTGEIINNVTPTFFAIKENESGEVLAEAYRNHTIMSKENGGPSEQSTGSVKLEVGKSYTLEGVLSYYNIDSASSKTSRSINLFVNSTGITSDAADLSINMLPTSYLPDANAFNHMSPIDHKSGGTIKASGNKTGDDGGTSYYYDGAAFITTGFTVTTELPQNGYLIIAVPDAFTENSDNDTMNDDRLAIRYTIVETSDPIPPPGQAAFGDLNLGMPEYRDLHYIAQYEVPPEEEEGGDEGGEGEGAEDAEPPEPIIVTEERYSGYGYYKSAESAPKSEHTEDYEEKVENRRDIWNFNFFTQTYV